MAVDVGSTTIAAHLCDLQTGEVVASAGRMNPQIRFGEDLMSRVSYVMMNPGGDREMTQVVREALNELAQETAKEAGVDPLDIMEVTIAGNPIMHHLVLGIDPTPLGFAPFALTTDEATELWATEIELYLNPGTRVYVLPCIAGHVGADAAGVVLSEMPYHADEMTLIVDVGTNAEIILGDKNRLLAASSPTGPAFEGAQISSGQRAAPGAIERVRINPDTLESRFKVIGEEAWSDDPGFASVPTGICGSGIIEVLAELYLAGILTTDGVIDGALASRTPRIVQQDRTFAYVLHEGSPTITVTQNDIRQIQLAKGALYAGARLLMDHMGIDTLDRITLAGAFGSNIDTKFAMILGMIPDCDLAKVTSAGNAAGTGARIALLNVDARRGTGKGRARHRKDRDRRRTEVPGTFRRSHGHPPQDGALPAPEGRGRPAGTQIRRGGRGKRRRRPTAAAARTKHRLGQHRRSSEPDPKFVSSNFGFTTLTGCLTWANAVDRRAGPDRCDAHHIAQCTQG